MGLQYKTTITKSSGSVRQLMYPQNTCSEREDTALTPGPGKNQKPYTRKHRLRKHYEFIFFRENSPIHTLIPNVRNSVSLFSVGKQPQITH